jgi:hypothetical protein
MRGKLKLTHRNNCDSIGKVDNPLVIMFGSYGGNLMRKEEVEIWLEVGKLAASIATPIVVAILGVLLLRRIESVKATVAQQSGFHKKWADQFFECCQLFMQALERELALLTSLFGLKSPNDEFGAELQKEISRLHPTLSELELRIRRSVVFAPLTGGAVAKAASECIALTGTLVAMKKGNMDDIIDKMNEFNVASRKAHAEMLGLSVVAGKIEDGS